MVTSPALTPRRVRTLGWHRNPDVTCADRLAARRENRTDGTTENCRAVQERRSPRYHLPVERARAEGVVRAVGTGWGRGAADRPPAIIDRSSYQQYLAQQAKVLPCEGNYLQILATAHLEHQQNLDRAFATAVDRTLSVSGRGLVNECLREIAASVLACVERAGHAWDSDKRRLAAALYETPVTSSDTVNDVMARDPFHGVLPYFDGPAMAALAGPAEVPGSLREELKQTLHHRLLHGPQRTRQLFFHEMAVGYFLNLLENEGAIPTRAEVKVQTTSYAAIPALFMRALADHLDRDVAALALLHFGRNEELDHVLPHGIRDLMTACAYLYFCCELAVVYQWKGRNGAIIEHVVKFFGLPVLERMSREPLRLRADAGRAVERLLIDALYGSGATSRANEVDLVVALHELSETMWAPAPAASRRSKRRAAVAAR
jgi:hypothetical protein